jgi:hypothetical protein
VTPLKYRFVAHYKGGTRYKQNTADVSVTDPIKSCYHDVDHSQLRLFALHDDNDHGVRVDLYDGCFEICPGRAFYMHDTSERLRDFRLVYSRRVEIEYEHSLNQPDCNEIGRKVTYRIGWTAKRPDGTEIERVMEVE